MIARLEDLKLDILDRINKLLGQREQQDLTNYLGLKKSAYTSWKSGNSKSYRKYLIEIAEFFNVSIDYLVNGEEEKNSSSEQLSEEEQKILEYFKKLSPEKREQLIGIIEEFAETSAKQKSAPPVITRIVRIRLPIADFAAGAGVSVLFDYDDKFTSQEFDYGDVPVLADCGVPINGISMEPNYPNGCIVWVQRKKDEDIEDGDVVVVIINGEPLCKIYDNKVYYSINEKAGFPPIKPTETDNVTILGKVIGFYNET